MEEPYLGWFTRPIHLPFPFLPLPSLAAVFTVGAFGLALLCLGMRHLPKRWPFRTFEPTFPSSSPAWWLMALALFVSAGLGTWRLARLSDLITALAWNLASALFVLLRLHTRRSARIQLRANAPERSSR